MELLSGGPGTSVWLQLSCWPRPTVGEKKPYWFEVNEQLSNLYVLKGAGINYPEQKCYILDRKSV